MVHHPCMLASLYLLLFIFHFKTAVVVFYH